MSTSIARPIVLDMSEVFGIGATSPKRSSPIVAKLESWVPSRPATADEVKSKLDEAAERRSDQLAVKTSKLVSSPTKAAEVAAARQAEIATLATAIATKFNEALARADAELQRKVTVAHKMSNVKVEEFRQEEKTSLAFTRELNLKRHADAEARAEAVRQRRAAVGARMARSRLADVQERDAEEVEAKRVKNEQRMAAALARAAAAQSAVVAKGCALAAGHKYAKAKEHEAATLEAMQSAQEKRMAAALARAEANKQQRVEVAAKMSASEQAAAVAEAQKAQVEANREKLALKQAEVASRALDVRMAKVDKAVRMSGSPISKARENAKANGEKGEAGPVASPSASSDDNTGHIADSATPISSTTKTIEDLVELTVPVGIAAVPQPTEKSMLDAAASTGPLFMTPEGAEENEDDKANDELTSTSEIEGDGKK